MMRDAGGSLDCKPGSIPTKASPDGWMAHLLGVIDAITP